MTTVEITMLGHFAVTVDSMPVAEASWTRRHAAALVKVLALAPDRRLHREQLVDRVWPEDTLDEAVPKLHKAAHYARRALGVADAVVLRGDHVALLPGTETTVDVLQFEELARRALVNEDVVAARARSPCTAASCCRRIATTGGPRSAVSSCACATSTCCASTAAGTSWSSSMPATRRLTSR